jgi:aspartate carbamoyltransferase catalytic subunit
MDFRGSHILSVDQFAREDIATIFTTAARMEPFAQRRRVTRVLEGAVLGNLFFEPSTRTRVSFVAAFNRLGGSVSATTGFQFSSMVKGESVYDAGRVMAGYADVLVMRHPVEGSVQEFAGASHVPVINGGDGPGEHPTQALLDLYTIQQETGRDLSALDGLRIAMVGDLRYGRTVHSLTKLLSLFRGVTFVFIAPGELQMPEAIATRVRNMGLEVHETEDLEAGIADVDVVYATRIQQERFTTPEDADKYRGLYSINRAVYEKHCRPGTVLMHPLPRDSRPGANELDADLNGHPALAIFRQTDNGIPIRMALFALVLGVEDRVEEGATDVRWYVPRRLGTQDTLDYGELPHRRR